MMIRLHPEAGVIISWTPDCLSQVMMESLENKDWDNGQLSPPQPQKHLWLGLFTYAYLYVLLFIVCVSKSKLMSAPQR
jgi:hypothetical protein